MKKTMRMLGLVAVAALLSTETKAQGPTAPYTYTYGTAAYSNLDENASLILGNTGWDDTTVVFTLPADFNFKYQGTAVTTWRMDTYGGVYPNDLDVSLELPAIIGVQSDFVDNGNSKISYNLTGAIGSRIAKVEFRNMGFFDGDAADSASFQVWLYEGTNKIEYHVGSSNITAGLLDPVNGGGNFISTGLMYAVAGGNDLLMHTIRYAGGTNTDTTFTIDASNGSTLEQALAALYSTTAYPVNGSVFTFVPKAATSVKNITARIGSVSPNPATDKITLQLKNAPAADALVAVYTITGQQVIRQKVTATNTDIALNGLTKGVYLLSYYADGARETLRIIKK